MFHAFFSPAEDEHFPIVCINMPFLPGSSVASSCATCAALAFFVALGATLLDVALGHIESQRLRRLRSALGEVERIYTSMAGDQSDVRGIAV